MLTSIHVYSTFAINKKYMNKIIVIVIASLIITLPIKAQEKLIIKGKIDIARNTISDNFKRNILCYLKGNADIEGFTWFYEVEVDSVISGSFLDLSNEIKKTPFKIPVLFINETQFLKRSEKCILEIKQFPYSEYYYIDSLKNVFPNEKHLDELTQYKETYLQNTKILTQGTSQEKYNILSGIFKSPNWLSKNYRYIPYFIPFMTSKDSIVVDGIEVWDGYDSLGNMFGGGRSYKEKQLFSSFLNNYLRNILPPATLPKETTDSVGWHEWYDNLFLKNKCFHPIKYAPSNNEIITNETSYISYFITNTANRKIYIAADYNKSYYLDINTDKSVRKTYSKNYQTPYISSPYSIKKNEIVYTLGNKISLCSLLDGINWEQNIDIPFPKENFGSSWHSYLNDQLGVKHVNHDFLVFYPSAIVEDSTDKCNYYLKEGRLNQNGEWVTVPKNLYKSSYTGSCANGNMDVLTICQSPKNEIAIAFSDKINLYSSISDKEYTNAIVVCILNSKLDIIKKVMLPTDFQAFNYTSFESLDLLKNGKTFLVVTRIGSKLYYLVMNNDLKIKTDFIQLADSSPRFSENIILTSEGFMISWVDNDLLEDVVRSVIIDKTGKQSNIINITNHKIDKLYNVESDKKNVDIYLFSNDEKKIIRKRINKKEFGLYSH